MRRYDVDWKQIFNSWSNHDLDALEREIQEERVRRSSPRYKNVKSVDTGSW